MHRSIIVMILLLGFLSATEGAAAQSSKSRRESTKTAAQERKHSKPKKASGAPEKQKTPKQAESTKQSPTKELGVPEPASSPEQPGGEGTTPQLQAAPKEVPLSDKIIGTDEKGRTIYEGPRGGHYYRTESGSKVYVKRKKP